jgi:hypothetical protein
MQHLYTAFRLLERAVRDRYPKERIEVLATSLKESVETVIAEHGTKGSVGKKLRTIKLSCDNMRHKLKTTGIRISASNLTGMLTNIRAVAKELNYELAEITT